jgi:hypothetical protein
VQDECSSAGSFYAPVVVVEQHVVETTEQDAAVYVGASEVLPPVVAMMCFAVRGGHGASGEHAAAVTDGERDSLPCRVEALLSSDVEGIAVGVDGDVDVAGAAEGTVDDGARDGSPRSSR